MAILFALAFFGVPIWAVIVLAVASVPLSIKGADSATQWDRYPEEKHAAMKREHISQALGFPAMGVIIGYVLNLFLNS